MKNSNAILTILGCGTSTGVPLPGCTCSVCLSSSAKNKRDRASVWLQTSAGTSILFDAGPDLRQQALRQRIPKVDAVLFTHAHADHILGVEDLRGFNFVQRSPIDCYGTDTTLQSIRATFPYIFNPDPEYKGGMLARLQLHSLEHFKAIEIQGVSIIPFPLLHGPLPVTGFKIGNIAYATDCNYIPPETMSLLQDIDILILDALRHEAHGTHFSIGEAIEAAKATGASQTFFTHMTHSIDYEIENPRLPTGYAFCYDGLELPVSLA